MRIFVTGCAGFIGSNLVDRLLSEGHEVIGYDNFSTGRKKFLENALTDRNFILHEADLLDSKKLNRCLEDVDLVFHLAANADVRFGLDHPKKDLENNTIATFNLLEAMRSVGCNQIAFSSTGSVYGEAEIIPTPENCPFPIQTSLYGASKLACEGLIQAYSEGYDFQAWIFRFVSILGERYTHGHVYDFYKKLKNDPSKLEVLGNGYQKKSYLYVHDCLDAISVAIKNPVSKSNLYNLGVNNICTVRDSIGWICDELKVEPELIFEDSDRGWIGDNPHIHLDTTKINSFKWQPKFSIEESVRRTVRYLHDNQWVFDESR